MQQKKFCAVNFHLIQANWDAGCNFSNKIPSDKKEVYRCKNLKAKGYLHLLIIKEFSGQHFTLILYNIFRDVKIKCEHE